MSKIKIQGNASGTGVVTLIAPNTNTDKTVTLPDSTDTLVGQSTTDTLTSNATALTTRVNAVGGRKNLILNGAMNVAQRGTSVTGLGDGDEGYVTLDRMRHTAAASAGRFTSAQSAISDLPGFLNCLHLDCTTADTSIAASELLVLEHRIEGQDLQQLKKGTASAEDITVSFYMKTNKAFTFTCVLNDFDNNRVNPQQFTTTTTWTRHSLTFSGDTTGTLDDDGNNSLTVSIYLHAGSDFTGGTYSANTWQSRASSDNMVAVGIGSFYDSTANDIKLTALQLELGDQATDFEHRSYGEELALCQRYYCKAEANGVEPLSNGHWYTSTTLRAFIPFPQAMRVSPTFSGVSVTNMRGGYGGGSAAVSGISSSRRTTNMAWLDVTSSGTQGQGASLFGYSGITALTFDAEL
jgi:hypothetical protein